MNFSIRTLSPFTSSDTCAILHSRKKFDHGKSTVIEYVYISLDMVVSLDLTIPKSLPSLHLTFMNGELDIKTDTKTFTAGYIHKILGINILN